MTDYTIAVIPGDGIGKEVVPAAIDVVDAAGRRFGFRCHWTSFDWGCERYTETGRMMPEDGLDQLRRHQAYSEIGEPHSWWCGVHHGCQHCWDHTQPQK